MNSAPPEPGPVLLYDGECGLCDRTVRLLLRMDSAGRLRYAALQGAAAQAFLEARGLPRADFSSLVFVSDWSRRGTAPFSLRTAGVIAALRLTGRTGRFLAGALAIVPAAWRDAGYRIVARWRTRLFGAPRGCPLPRPEWKARFLDD
jgi:predicted DCC family thiol-disulfide oxidoreductase YuxK